MTRKGSGVGVIVQQIRKNRPFGRSQK